MDSSKEMRGGGNSGCNRNLVSRKDAREARLTRYFTGAPCKYGHIAERLVEDGYCTECKKVRRAAYYAKNQARENENGKAYYAENRDAELARKARYNTVARALRTATQNKRRASVILRTPPWFGEFDELVVVEAYDLARRRQIATGRAWAVDHMIPLQAKRASGLHCGHNLQVIPKRLNNIKLNRLTLTEPGEWVRLLYSRKRICTR